MTPPTTYRIVPGEAVDYLPGKTWAYHAACKDWSKMGGPLAYFPGETHYCHSEKRPTHDPTAPASPASSAAKGGDIPRTPTDSEALARLFHDTYERLAPEYGYETRPETRIFDPNSKNGKLMIAVCAAVAAETQKGVRG